MVKQPTVAQRPPTTTKASRSDARCPVCGRKPKRSTEQNRHYWLLLHLLAERIKPGGVRYSPDSWHLWAKSRFLGADDVTMPNGKTMTVTHSSADLSTDEFHDYVTAIEAFAAERDVYLDEMP